MMQFYKRKRLQISDQVQSVNMRQTSQDKRKSIEKQFNDYLKTTNQFHSSNSFKHKSPLKNQTHQEFHQKFNSDSPSEVNQQLLTPTEKQISYKNQNSSLKREFYQEESHEKQHNQSQDIIIQEKEKSNQINKQVIHSPVKKTIEENINSLPEENSIIQEKQNMVRQENDSEIHDEQIKVPALPLINNSVSSFNNSEAIFFTSQFQDYINKQSPGKDIKISQEIKEQQFLNEKNSISIKIDEEKEKQMKHNPSARSLSNDSSLKYSMINDSAPQEQFYSHIQAKGRKSLAESLLRRIFKKTLERNFIQEIKKFHQIWSFSKKVALNNLRQYFESFLMMKQYNFEIKKNELKCDNFKKFQELKLIEGVFTTWKNQYELKQFKSTNMLLRSQKHQKAKIFRILKMFLFERRINSQVDAYYLSKIFSKFKETVEKQSKASKHKADKFYLNQLKKRYFYHVIEGVNQLQKEREDLYLAIEHHQFHLTKRIFESWKDVNLGEEKFIKLAMTTKNVFKQTTEKGLMQTRTIDFKAIT